MNKVTEKAFGRPRKNYVRFERLHVNASFAIRQALLDPLGHFGALIVGRPLRILESSESERTHKNGWSGTNQTIAAGIREVIAMVIMIFKALFFNCPVSFLNGS